MLKMHEITLNGETKIFPENDFPKHIADLLERLSLDTSSVTVELNDQPVDRDRYAETPLCEGCKVELVQFVGGG